MEQVPQSTKDRTSVRKFNFGLTKHATDVSKDGQKQRSRPNKHSNLLQ